jgi:OOP family OmpA-OmpF porin
LLNSGEPSVYGASIGQVAYKNQTHQFSVDAIYSLNPNSNYRGNPRTNVYLLGGYSLNAARVTYKTKIPGGGQPDGYAIFYGLQNPNSQSGLVGTMGGAEINNRHAYAIFHGLDLGGGIAFKINDRVNIGFEHKFTFTFPGYDFLDAYKAGNNDDYYGFTSVRLNINLGNKSRRVEPLWWYNANNYIYGEVNRPVHMKLPPVVLPDGDGDGVTDQFDLEPNTPKGCPVDSHGVSRDTDGDGVPDCRDREVLTPKNCFPVNSDGVGTCPEPACCKELRDMMATRPVTVSPTCTMGNLPSVQFKGNARLSKSAEASLAQAANTIKANPNCKVKVLGYGASSKAAQQSSWERVNAVIKYLVERQGIAESRLIFSYGMDGDSNTVDLQSTTEDGPSAVPAPHPNLKG